MSSVVVARLSYNRRRRQHGRGKLVAEHALEDVDPAAGQAGQVGNQMVLDNTSTQGFPYPR